MNGRAITERLRQAVTLQNDGDLDGAEAIYLEVLTRAPKQPDALHLLALIALARDRPGAAVDWAERACAAAPTVANFRNTAGEARRRTGDITAAESSFVQAIKLDPGMAMAYRNLALVQAARGDDAAAWSSVSRALALRLDFPEALLTAAQLAVRRHDLVNIDALAARLVAYCGDWLDARVTLSAGKVALASAALEQGDPAAAEALSREAIAYCPDVGPAWNNLGVALREQERIEAAEFALTVALACSPDDDRQATNLAALLREDDRLDEAEGYLRALLESDPENVGGRFMLARVLLQRGDYAAGWPLFESRWEYRGEAPPGGQETLWRGEALAGKSLLVVGEQGFGDNLQTLRFVPAAADRAAATVLVVAAPLVELARRALSGRRVDVTSEFPARRFDFFCPLFSLPRALAVARPEQVDGAAYLVADARKRQHFRQRLAGCAGLKVGLAWRGADHFGNRRRAVPEAAWAPVLSIPGIDFVSLQHDRGPPPTGDTELLDLADAVEDFDDLAALIAELDLVISIDSAPAHLAGGLGVPTWVIVPRVRDWRWGNATDVASPWYASMRLFRQHRPADWAEPLAAIAEALAARCGGRPEEARRHSGDSPVPAERTLRRHDFPWLVADCRHGVLRVPLLDRYIGRSLLVYGEYSEAELACCRDWIRPGDTVLDIGANIGALAVPLARRVGRGGRLLAFEPQASIFACLQANLRENGLDWAEARHAAVGAENAEIDVPCPDLRRSGNFGGVELGAPTPGASCVRVDVVTIDSLELDACRLIKVDVEGAESAVLAGARRTLCRCRPVLHVECDRPSNWPALRDLLVQCGYRIYAERPPLFSSDNYRKIAADFFPNMVSGNLLCIPVEWPSLAGRREVLTAP